MSVSSISSLPASPQVKAPDVTETKAPDLQADSDADKVGASQPTVLAPLPPGQGTRIDQLV
jgi:hypothetical protein